MTEALVTLLGFDYGEKHIGVAVGQTLTASASPLACVDSKRSKPDWSAIANLVEAWQPDAFVVGLPLNMDGSDQAMTHAARRFGNQLQARFRRPVHLADERLSTREAKTRLFETGRAGADDHPVAAQVILEGFLAERRPP
jgi:putative Holliday junction resolvase